MKLISPTYINVKGRLREQMSLVNVPKGMQGTPIDLITAGLLAMAFMGFSGVVKL